MNNISTNIAHYRKTRNLTQEELGSRLGVSNQAVSKWENGSCMPDISLLPALTKALGITFEQLYGLECPTADRIPPDDFPDTAYDALHETFARLWNPNRHGNVSRQEGIRHDKEQLEKILRFTCISNRQGGVTATGAFSYIDRSFKGEGSEKIFANDLAASAMRRLSDRNVRRVLAWQLKTAVERDKETDSDFTLEEIAAGCGLSPEETEDALGILCQFEINEAISGAYTGESYCLIYGRALDASALFHTADLLVASHAFHAVRDTSMILDRAFIEED